MEIGFKKKQLNINLILGLFWLIWFFVRISAEEEPGWMDYGWIILSLLYFGLYYYQRQYKYVTIKNGTIHLNGISGKKLNLNDIKTIRKFAGDYILKTDTKELTINTQIIDPDSLAELDAALEKLEVEWR